MQAYRETRELTEIREAGANTVGEDHPVKGKKRQNEIEGEEEESKREVEEISTQAHCVIQ